MFHELKRTLEEGRRVLNMTYVMFFEPMPELDRLLGANREYAETFDRSSLEIPPKRKLAVVACMDARLTVEDFLGLRTGDAHIIRNAGGVVTHDEIRSLIISTELLGTREILVVNHTDCGMLTFKDIDLQKKLSAKYRTDASKLEFHAFESLSINVKEQVKKIRESPFIPREIPVNGFIYDVKTGRLQKVV